MSRSDFQSYVNDITGRDIKFLHLENLNRDDSWWHTVAIELSDEDYNVINDSDNWENGIRLRQFTGFQFWRRNPRIRYTPSSDGGRSAVRESWNS